MPATMVRYGGRVQIEQSDMPLTLNTAKMAIWGFLRTTIDETQQQIKKPCVIVREEKKWGVEFHGHILVKAAIERHPAMVYKNHMDGCLPCQNCTTNNPQSGWRHRGTGAPTPEPAAPPPRKPSPPGPPPALRGDTDSNESYEIEGMPSRCVYIHSRHPNSQLSIIIYMPRIASTMKI